MIQKHNPVPTSAPKKQVSLFWAGTKSGPNLPASLVEEFLTLPKKNLVNVALLGLSSPFRKRSKPTTRKHRHCEAKLSHIKGGHGSQTHDIPICWLRDLEDTLTLMFSAAACPCSSLDWYTKVQRCCGILWGRTISAMSKTYWKGMFGLRYQPCQSCTRPLP